MKNSYLILKFPEHGPPSLLRDHEILEIGGVLVADPQQRRDNVQLSAILGGDMPRTQGEVEVLHEKEDVGGELNPLAKADG